jgi:hypothetical protein
MRQRNKPERHKVSVEWYEVTYDEMPPAQQAAWDWLWRRLLSPPAPETTKAPGGSTPEATDETRERATTTSVISAGATKKDPSYDTTSG